MKQFKLVTVIAVCLFFLVSISGCADTKIIDGIKYDTHGLFNKEDKKNPEIQYEVVWGNVIWGAILFETIVMPIYFYGFSMWEPVGKKTDIKGQIQ